jgi:ligand-binding SRPBCC domain-containing protein
MIFLNAFEVRAPLEAVADFHAQSASMAAITPPPVMVRVHRAEKTLRDGDEMDFTLWLGPLPVRWLAKIEATTRNGFVDRQIKGPFKKWAHRHSFERVDDTTTRVRDEIHIRLQRHPLWGTIGFLMMVNLPFLFAYRAWKTRRLLEKEP